jgi:predicted RNA-binding protein with PIN domain
VRKKYHTKKPDGLADFNYRGTSSHTYKNREKYLLVDGYNIIFAWEELSELAKINIDSARDKLLDILSNYHGTKQGHLIVVFDAYRVKGHQTEIMDIHNIHVVYTKEAETADNYIEKFAHDHHQKYEITVATSDHLEQIIITGQGCHLISARELEKIVKQTEIDIREQLEQKKLERNTLADIVKKAVEEKND